MTYQEKLKDPRWQKKSGIYRLTINGNIYIGSAVDLTKRIRSHVNDLKGNRHINIHLQRAYNKYKDFDFNIIEFVFDKKELIKAEQSYIDKLSPHYNICPTAGSQLGFSHSEETKLKLSQIQMGKTIPLETRLKMSQSKKGVKLSIAHRLKLSKSKMGDKNPFYKAGKNHPQYGVPRSKVTKEKLSGENNPQSKSGVLYDVVTGVNHIFFSLKPLCTKLELEYRGVLSALRNERFYRGRYYINFINIPKVGLIDA